MFVLVLVLVLVLIVLLVLSKKPIDTFVQDNSINQIVAELKGMDELLDKKINDNKATYDGYVRDAGNQLDNHETSIGNLNKMYATLSNNVSGGFVYANTDYDNRLKSVQASMDNLSTNVDTQMGSIKDSISVYSENLEALKNKSANYADNVLNTSKHYTDLVNQATLENNSKMYNNAVTSFNDEIRKQSLMLRDVTDEHIASSRKIIEQKVSKLTSDVIAEDTAIRSLIDQRMGATGSNIAAFGTDIANLKLSTTSNFLIVGSNITTIKTSVDNVGSNVNSLKSVVTKNYDDLGKRIDSLSTTLSDNKKRLDQDIKDKSFEHKSSVEKLEKKIYDKTSIDQNFYKKSEVDSGFYSKTNIDQSFYKRSESDQRYYNKTEIDTNFTNKTDMQNLFYKKKEVDDLIQTKLSSCISSHNEITNQLQSVLSSINGANKISNIFFHRNDWLVSGSSTKYQLYIGGSSGWGGVPGGDILKDLVQNNLVNRIYFLNDQHFKISIDGGYNWHGYLWMLYVEPVSGAENTRLMGDNFNFTKDAYVYKV